MRETDEVESVQQQPGSMEAYNRMVPEAEPTAAAESAQ
jgi:hypothetical protein